jgi:hypothetical protein
MKQGRQSATLQNMGNKKPARSGLWKIGLVCGGCAAVTIAAGAYSIWLGIALMPVMYAIADAALAD